MKRVIVSILSLVLLLPVGVAFAQSPFDAKRVEHLAQFDAAWSGSLGDIGSTFGRWTSNLADTQLQQLAELAVVDAIAELDGLVREECFLITWATARSALVLRAESYAAVVKPVTDPILQWASMEEAIALLTGAIRLQQLVTMERAKVTCVTLPRPTMAPTAVPVVPAPTAPRPTARNTITPERTQPPATPKPTTTPTT